MVTLTFIIPIRHYENIRNIDEFNFNLQQTVHSINLQTSQDWQAIIVVNTGTLLPELPKNFKIKYVDFKKNENHEYTDEISLEGFRDSVRLDKGKRILAGMLEAEKTRYFMVVDDDDLISKHLTSYVSMNNTEYGWKINKGYVWQSKSNLLYAKNNFNKICGTSLIIQSNLYGLKKDINLHSEEYIKNMLGSHVKIDEILAINGTPLKNLPFRGAIYRVGHICSHSQNGGIFKYFITLRDFKNPKQLMYKILHLRYFFKRLKNDFLKQ